MLVLPPTDMIILIVYLLVVLVAGLLFSKKEMQGKEFFKGDGTVPGMRHLFPFLSYIAKSDFLYDTANLMQGLYAYSPSCMIFAIPVAIFVSSADL